MSPTQPKLKIGIIGCGAIGSRIAKSVKTDLKQNCRITGLYDIHRDKSQNLAKALKLSKVVKNSVENLIRSCDLIVEAVSSQDTLKIIKQAIQAKKHVLAMSVGKLLKAQSLFKLAQKNRCALLIPSGAIAGIDAIKAASLVKIKKLVLTTRKPLKGFVGNPYLERPGFEPEKIKKETEIFAGSVFEAVKHFPQNINVAATIALATGQAKKLKVRILTSPKFKNNSHEIFMESEAGCLKTTTENVICPDNPKTSYLAVLSGIQTLKQFVLGTHLGT